MMVVGIGLALTYLGVLRTAGAVARPGVRLDHD
jgi:hypothetical protein